MQTNKFKIMLTETGGFHNSTRAQDIDYLLGTLEQNNAYPDPNGGGFMGWMAAWVVMLTTAYRWT